MSAVHLHLLLNHVPVIGAVIGVGLLVLALLRRSDEIGKAALGLFVVLAGVSGLVFLTGEPAEELVEKLPGFSESLTHQHEEVAEAALIAMVAVGLFSAFGLLRFRKRALARWMTPTALLLSVCASGIMGYAANLGGMIRHTEIRSGTVSSPANDTDDDDTPRR